MRINKSSVYLYAFYSNFGNSFIDFYNRLEKGNVYIGDLNYSESFMDEDIIFSSIKRDEVTWDRDISLVQSNSNYICDYKIDEDYQMIVFNVQGEHIKALRNFKKSIFSNMYNKIDIKKHFNLSEEYYIKYEENNKWIKITTSNCSDILNKINYNLDKIRISPFHVLSQSSELRELLECIYDSYIPNYNELISPIDLNLEVLNYNNKHVFVDNIIKNIANVEED